jgi:hypothetical protein
MRYLFGAVLIVVGVGQFLLRDRIARANAASNKVMYNGAFSGRTSTSAMKIGSVLAAVVFVVVGVLMLAGVIGG